MRYSTAKREHDAVCYVGGLEHNSGAAMVVVCSAAEADLVLAATECDYRRFAGDDRT